MRSGLAGRGISFGLLETSEVLGNPTGGIQQGAIYEGLTEASMGLDLARLIGIENGVINFSAFQIHGRGLSTNNIGNLNNVRSIEATRGTKLFELFYQQGLAGGKLDVRVGQLAADQEFLNSQYSSSLMNSTSFGWPELPSQDVPGSGPIYPLATPGVRARWSVSSPLTVMAGIYNGNPAGPGPGDPQLRDASGTAFRLNDGIFAIAEAQYIINGSTHPTGLPGSYKVGAWFESQGTFSQQFDNTGRSLANPLASGQPRALNGDYSVYGMVDQLIYREPGTINQGAAIFFRVMGAPEDRNPISFFADGGLTYKGLVPGRNNDTAAVGVSVSRISPVAGHLDGDRQFYSGARTPIRSSEGVLELTYEYQAAAWWLIQPDLQYVFNPSGEVLDPVKPARNVGDAFMLGLRLVVTL
ncbi:carbohydrate porin [Lichenicoccus roseus]|uniref:carbohydrate porin n=1 Tax=Lichenicoccus roseus TaxID=2683649 RepID=UPI001485D9CB|nr:carbohydrate porin [Lichenicoccus roseus]